MSIINNLYKHFGRFLANRHPKIFNFCQKRKAIIKFVIAGGFATVIDLLALYLFHGVLHWDIVLATSLAFLLSFFVSFSLQKLWTFRNYNKKRLPHQLVLYFGAAFISMNLNALTMHLMVNRWHVWYLLAQIIVNIFLGIINFFTYKFVVFRHIKDED